MGRVVLRGGALTAPVPPALVTVGAGEVSNVLTVAWTGILATVPPKTYISVRKRRYSHRLLTENGEFAVNLAPAHLAKAVDFCGMYTGEKVDKFERCHLTRLPSRQISVPSIAECPLTLECRVCEVREMGSHDVFIADILAVTVDEALMDRDGKLHIERADLLAYAHGEYYTLGRRLGAFGFSAAKKKSAGGKDGRRNAHG